MKVKIRKKKDKSEMRKQLEARESSTLVDMFTSKIKIEIEREDYTAFYIIIRLQTDHGEIAYKRNASLCHLLELARNSARAYNILLDLQMPKDRIPPIGITRKYGDKEDPVEYLG